MREDGLAILAGLREKTAQMGKHEGYEDSFDLGYLSSMVAGLFDELDGTKRRTKDELIRMLRRGRDIRKKQEQEGPQCNRSTGTCRPDARTICTGCATITKGKLI